MAVRNGKRGKAKPVVVQREAGENDGRTMARVLAAPYLRHGVLTHLLAEKAFGEVPSGADFGDFSHAIKTRAKEYLDGDKAFPSELLMAQAISLDTLYFEMARRSAMNMNDYPQATERYARLAFKAQANSRATLEALAKLHQPREQTVRHVHVNEGGQAVIADQFHHHTGGQENGQSNEQPHATGTSSAGTSPAMLGQDPNGEPLPITSREGPGAMSDARGERQWRA